MKKLILLIAVVIAIMTTGCSTKESGPMLAFEGKMKVNSELRKSIKIGGSYDLGSVITPVSNLAIALRKAALYFESQNVKYFYISKEAQVPYMITNFKDLSNYCYPSDQVSSSLEDKCNISFNKKTFNNDIGILLIETDKSFSFDSWSVEQVLNDQDIGMSMLVSKAVIKKEFYFTNKPFVESIYERRKFLEENKRNQYIQKF
jgi:hypothetical protein